MTSLLIQLGSVVHFRGDDQLLRAALVIGLPDNEPEAWVKEGTQLELTVFDRYGPSHHTAALDTNLEQGTCCPHDIQASRLG